MVARAGYQSNSPMSRTWVHSKSLPFLVLISSSVSSKVVVEVPRSHTAKGTYRGRGDGCLTVFAS